MVKMRFRMILQTITALSIVLMCLALTIGTALAKIPGPAVSRGGGILPQNTGVAGPIPGQPSTVIKSPTGNLPDVLGTTPSGVGRGPVNPPNTNTGVAGEIPGVPSTYYQAPTGSLPQTATSDSGSGGTLLQQLPAGTGISPPNTGVTGTYGTIQPNTGSSGTLEYQLPPGTGPFTQNTGTGGVIPN